MNGNWRLSPVYDLTFSRTAHGFHSTTIAGEGSAPGKPHLLELAKIFSVRDSQKIIEQVQETISHWRSYAQKSGVGKASSDLIHQTLAQIRKR